MGAWRTAGTRLTAMRWTSGETMLSTIHFRVPATGRHDGVRGLDPITVQIREAATEWTSGRTWPSRCQPMTDWTDWQRPRRRGRYGRGLGGDTHYPLGGGTRFIAPPRSGGGRRPTSGRCRLAGYSTLLSTGAERSEGGRTAMIERWAARPGHHQRVPAAIRSVVGVCGSSLDGRREGPKGEKDAPVNTV